MKNKNKNNQSMTRKNLSNLSTEEKILRLKKQIQEGEVFCDDTRALIPNAIITEQNRVASAHEFLMDTTNHIEAAEQELNEINFQIHALRQALEEEIQAERSKIAYIETLKAYEYEHRKCIEDHDSRLESAIATHVNSWRITSKRAYEKKVPQWKEQLEALQKKVDEKTKKREYVKLRLGAVVKGYKVRRIF
jgi:hypothetical protein